MDHQAAETSAAGISEHSFVSRIVGILVVLAVNLFSSLIPLKIVRHGKAKSGGRCQTVVEFCHSIGGGVFLGTCFTGLFPFVRKKLESVSVREHVDYPLAEGLLLVGFFVVAAIEQLVGACSVSKRTPGAVHYRPTDASTEHVAHHDGSEDELFLTTSPLAQSDGIHGCDDDDGGVDHSCHTHVAAAVADHKTSLVRGLFLVSAIGLHATFEGVAVGLQVDLDLAAFANLLLSVLLHEALCSFATGVSLARQRLSTTAVVKLGILFSLMLPAGMVAGVFLGEIPGQAGCIASGVLQGIANGTFLYVLFIEIIPVTLRMRTLKGLHLLCMLLGSATAAALATVMHVRHDAGRQHCGQQQVHVVNSSSVANATSVHL